MYRAPIHFENHKFKKRDRIAQMGISKSITSLDSQKIGEMNVINEEENESRQSSKFNSAKK